jgi:hypothetical protein
MAMVAMYGRRGIQLPMVLDDVLVNFDADRTRTAVQVLHDFSKEGHQLLFFTCHKHVWQMFQEIKADARHLPDRFETLASVEPVEARAIQSENPAPAPPQEERGETGKSQREPAPADKQRRQIGRIEVVESTEPLCEYSYEQTLDLEPPPVTEFEYEFEDSDQEECRPTEVEYSWESRLKTGPMTAHPTPLSGDGMARNTGPLVEPLVGVSSSAAGEQKRAGLD